MGLHSRASYTPMRQVEGAKIRIREIVNEGRSEVVVITNDGDADQPLTGWSLASLKGTQVFRFEDGAVLRPRTSIQITSGEGVAHRPPTVLGWTDETVWNNRGDIALLFDCDGEEVARFAYPEARAAQAGRLPKHVLVEGEDGAFTIEARKRRPSVTRSKVSRAGRSRG